MIDIHCHILPGIDDGARSKKEAIALLHKEKYDGVTDVIVTPHYRKGMFRPPIEEVVKRYRWLKHMGKQIGIRVWLGSELHATSNMMKYIQNKDCETLAGGSYVLVEFSSYHSYNNIREKVMQLLTLGYNPIIAHIERIPALEKEMTRLQELRDMGVELQVNAGSVLGEEGKKVKAEMLTLIKLGFVDYIASDCHRISERRPNLGDCYAYVRSKTNDEVADRIFIDNPKRIIRARR